MNLINEFDHCLMISRGIEEILLAFTCKQDYEFENYIYAFIPLENIMCDNNKNMENLLQKIDEERKEWKSNRGEM